MTSFEGQLPSQGVELGPKKMIIQCFALIIYEALRAWGGKVIVPGYGNSGSLSLINILFITKSLELCISLFIKTGVTLFYPFYLTDL